MECRADMPGNAATVRFQTFLVHAYRVHARADMGSR